MSRMTASPGSATYDSDALGNRSWKKVSGTTVLTYGWDVMNRLTSLTGTTTAIYEYRADGMRTWKRVGTSASGYTYELTRHDGQMPLEVEKITTSVSAIRNVLGARGIDAEETATGTISGTTRTLGTSAIAYPLYDAHGNRITTLTRSGSSWSCDTPRYYDAWGNVRSGSTTGGSPMRHCASLGHLQDDESGLVYMRARYYETATGRFLSQDRGHQGLNYFVYCGSNPVNAADKSGNWFYSDLDWYTKWTIALQYSPEFRVEAAAALVFWTILEAGEMVTGFPPNPLKRAEKAAAIGMLSAAFINESLSPLAVASPATRIEAYYIGHEAMLEITMFMLDLV